MSLYRIFALSLCAATVAVATPASARPNDARSKQISAQRAAREAPRVAWLDRPRDQDRAFREKQQGRSMPLPQIERRVLPQMGGADYLGPEIRGSNVRMKFLDRGKVIWVDVNPRTGQILGKSDD